LSPKTGDFFFRLDNPNITNKYYKYSDNTALTRAVCESLIKSKGLNMANLAEKLVETFTNDTKDDKISNRKYGSDNIILLEQLKVHQILHHLDEKCLKPSFNFIFGTGSLGNEAAMRVAPIALYTCNKSENEMIITAILATSITHSHYLSLVGCILQCFVIRSAYLFRKDDKTNNFAQFLDTIILFMKHVENNLLNIIQEAIEGKLKDVCKDMKFYLYWLEKRIERDTNFIEKHAYSNRLEKLKDLLNECQNGALTSLEEFHKNYAKCDVTALESIPVALFAFLVANDPKCENEVNSKLNTKNSFRKTAYGVKAKNFKLHNSVYDNFDRTIIYAITLGGDTNTIASMAGAIVGAFYGPIKLSESRKYYKYCEDSNAICETGNQLFKLTNCGVNTSNVQENKGGQKRKLS
jgi:poly(ADP-ribose) glycohydrolase ARH3